MKNTHDYQLLAEHMVTEDYRIGKDILLLDDYLLNKISNYEFVAPGNAFIQILKGKGDITINGKKYDVSENCLIVYFKGQSIRTNIPNGTVLQRSAIFTDNFLEQVYREGLKITDIRTSLFENPVIHMGKEAQTEMNIYVKQLQLIAKRPENGNNTECAIFATLTLFYGSLFSYFKSNHKASSFRSPKLAYEFISLIGEHFKEKRTQDFYADKLCISRRYLYDIVVSTTGKSPSYWLDYYLTAEAKKQIRDRQTSFMQIALNLNFSGLPAFCKFFKKQTGMSPGDYRKLISRPK